MWKTRSSRRSTQSVIIARLSFRTGGFYRVNCLYGPKTRVQSIFLLSNTPTLLTAIIEYTSPHSYRNKWDMR